MAEQVVILSRILYPNISNRVSDYSMIIEICEKRIKELEKKKKISNNFP